MTEVTKTLREVTIRSNKPMIENKIDKTIINVDAFLNNAGNTVLDALNNAPNVDVDINGNISVKGKPGVMIFIDGKQNYLVGSDLSNFLRSISASQVELIEIMTQPSAKYDASGTAGVINIKLKKNKQVGFNTTVNMNYTQGIYPKSTSSLILNYKKSKWNYFGNVSYSFNQNFTHRNLTRSILSGPDNSNILYAQDEHHYSKTPGITIEAGIDYVLNKKWNIGLLYTNKTNMRSDNLYDHSTFLDINHSGSLISFMEGLNQFNSSRKNNGFGMNLKKSINKKSDLTFDLNYEMYRFNDDQILTNTNYDPDGTIIKGPNSNPFVQKAIPISKIDIAAFKSDYTYVFNNLKFEAGVKSSFITSDNISNFYSMINGTLELDNNQSNRYRYDENINSLYGNINSQIKKWQFQLGLRGEETNTKGFVFGTKDQFNKSYVQLFPTLFIGNTVNNNNSFSLTYGRRIDRPNYLDLNPFTFLIDQYTFKRGNPNLSPYFTNNIELNYNYKQKLNITANYTFTKGIVDDIIIQNDTSRILLETKSNLLSLRNVGISFSYNSSIGKWGNIIFSDDLYNNRFTGLVYNHNLNKNITTNQINIVQQFHFNKGWNAEISFSYNNGSIFSAWNYRGERHRTNISVSKNIMKGLGNLKLKLSDPFNIEKGYGSNDFANIHTTIKFKEDSRRIGLTFSYRFQKGIKSTFKKMYTPEEAKRIM